MTTYTSTLPEEIIQKLNHLASEIKVPKNIIITKALEKYLYELERQIYISSFKKIAGDKELLDMAEIGMGDYLQELKNLEKK